MAMWAQLKHAWNALRDGNAEGRIRSYEGGVTYGGRPDRVRSRFANERSIISSIYVRLGIDVAGVNIKHVMLDKENQRYLKDMDSGLNNCLTLEANIDQAARHFRQDMAMSLFEEGCIAVVPVDTDLDPSVSTGFDIKTLRIGKIVGWMPKHVRIDLYNDEKGIRQIITLEKKFVAVVENPLYAVMNEPNSTLQRLIRKLNLLDAVDDQSSSGRLDVFIQLPYTVKSEARRTQAKQRMTDIEAQMAGSKYGIAYTDGTEKITQLNRPAENNLLKQVEYLTDLLYAQLGLTPAVINGTADEATMLHYMNRTIEPILDAITEAMQRTFLTKTGRTQGQAVRYFRDPFKFVPIGGIGGIADIADKLARNEIATSNDIRQVLGWKPSKDPKADQLVNSNMPAPSEPKTTPQTETGGNSQNGS